MVFKYAMEYYDTIFCINRYILSAKYGILALLFFIILPFTFLYLGREANLYEVSDRVELVKKEEIYGD